MFQTNSFQISQLRCSPDLFCCVCDCVVLLGFRGLGIQEIMTISREIGAKKVETHTDGLHLTDR